MKVELSCLKNLNNFAKDVSINMKFSVHENINDSNKVFKYYFYNLTDLYNYLSSNPKVNSSVFKELSSEEGSREFAGEPLIKAIEYLKGGYKINFDKFDIAVGELKKIGYEDTNDVNFERALHGGVYLSPLVAAGVPDCMIRYAIDTEPKKVTIYFQLCSPNFTSESQIFNRGVATLNLIQLLEEKGYIVEFKAFDLSRYLREYVDITVNLKHIDERLNISKCYYPLISKEFSRRLLFRVLECAPVSIGWGSGYGEAMDESEIRKFYKLDKNDLVISSPDDLGIMGKNTLEDTLNLFRGLGLENEFDLDNFESKIKTKKL